MRKKAQPSLPLGTQYRKDHSRKLVQWPPFTDEQTVAQGKGGQAGGPTVRQKPSWVFLGPVITSGGDLIPGGGGSITGGD